MSNIPLQKDAARFSRVRVEDGQTSAVATTNPYVKSTKSVKAYVEKRFLEKGCKFSK